MAFDLPNVSIGKAAKLLGVSTKTLRRWETVKRRGDMDVTLRPARTLGGHRRYFKESLKLLLDIPLSKY